MTATAKAKRGATLFDDLAVMVPNLGEFVVRRSFRSETNACYLLLTEADLLNDAEETQYWADENGWVHRGKGFRLGIRIPRRIRMGATQ